MLVTALVFILILSVLVLIHELGHFIVAKRLGIKVEEFGYGFPPRIWGKRIGETLYSINLLPIGGFVKLFGEDDAGGGKIQAKSAKSEVKNEKNLSSSDLKRAFYARPSWQRLSVVIAGVVMNFLLAVCIISYLFAARGVAVPSDHVRVTEILPNSPAAMSGLKIDDKIISVDGVKITKTEEFVKETRKHLGQPTKIVYVSDDKQNEVTLVPRKDFPKGEGPIGIGISAIEVRKYSLLEAPVYGTWEALKFSWVIVHGLGSMVYEGVIHGQKPEGVAGPLGVAQLTGEAVSFGLDAVLWFMALLSLNLAVLNILPIPALDGGRLFFILIEVVTRKKVNPKYESYAHMVGLALLLGLMAVVTIVDIARLISGKSLLPNM